MFNHPGAVDVTVTEADSIETPIASLQQQENVELRVKKEKPSDLDQQRPKEIEVKNQGTESIDNESRVIEIVEEMKVDTKEGDEMDEEQMDQEAYHEATTTEDTDTTEVHPQETVYVIMISPGDITEGDTDVQDEHDEATTKEDDSQEEIDVTTSYDKNIHEEMNVIQKPLESTIHVESHGLLREQKEENKEQIKEHEVQQSSDILMDHSVTNNEQTVAKEEETPAASQEHSLVQDLAIDRDTPKCEQDVTEEGKEAVIMLQDIHSIVQEPDILQECRISKEEQHNFFHEACKVSPEQDSVKNALQKDVSQEPDISQKPTDVTMEENDSHITQDTMHAGEECVQKELSIVSVGGDTLVEKPRDQEIGSQELVPPQELDSIQQEHCNVDGSDLTSWEECILNLKESDYANVEHSSMHKEYEKLAHQEQLHHLSDIQEKTQQEERNVAPLSLEKQPGLRSVPVQQNREEQSVVPPLSELQEHDPTAEQDAAGDEAIRVQREYVEKQVAALSNQMVDQQETGDIEKLKHDVLQSGPDIAQQGLDLMQQIQDVTQQRFDMAQQGHNVTQQGHNLTHDVTQQGHNMAQQGHDLTQQGRNLTQQGYNVTQQGHSVTQLEYDVTQQGYSVTQQGHSVTQQGHCVTQQGHNVTQQRHNVTQQGHNVTQQGHSVTQQGHNVTQQGHNVTQQEYDVTQQGHSVTQQGHNVTQQEYDVTQQGHNVTWQQGHNLTWQQGHDVTHQVPDMMQQKQDVIQGKQYVAQPAKDVTHQVHETVTPGGQGVTNGEEYSIASYELDTKQHKHDCTTQEHDKELKVRINIQSLEENKGDVTLKEPGVKKVGEPLEENNYKMEAILKLEENKMKAIPLLLEEDKTEVVTLLKEKRETVFLPEENKMEVTQMEEKLVEDDDVDSTMSSHSETTESLGGTPLMPFNEEEMEVNDPHDPDWSMIDADKEDNSQSSCESTEGQDEDSDTLVSSRITVVGDTETAKQVTTQHLVISSSSTELAQEQQVAFATSTSEKETAIANESSQLGKDSPQATADSSEVNINESCEAEGREMLDSDEELEHQQKSSLLILATDLLEQWSDLKEVYRIPKRSSPPVSSRTVSTNF